MKISKIILFLYFIGICHSVDAQFRNPFSISSEGYVDIDFKYGALNNDYSRLAMESVYKLPVNANDGNLTFSNSRTIGFDGKIGYFLNDKKTWGIAVGVMYLFQNGKLNLDTFHMEDSSVDAKNRVFRQILSSGNITESVNSNNISVPFLIHYQKRYSLRTFFGADFGVLYNLFNTYDYTTDAKFNYEAIYKYDVASKSFIYDNAPVVSGAGVVPMTVNQYYASNPKGTDLAGYFNGLSQKWGANIALGQQAKSTTGTVNYKHGSVGFMIEPTVNYQLSDYLFLRFGFYYIYQSFQLTGDGNKLPFTNKIGDYNSLLQEATSVTSQSFGFNIGFKMLLKTNNDENLSIVSPYSR